MFFQKKLKAYVFLWLFLLLTLFFRLQKTFFL